MNVQGLLYAMRKHESMNRRGRDLSYLAKAVRDNWDGPSHVHKVRIDELDCLRGIDISLRRIADVLEELNERIEQ